MAAPNITLSNVTDLVSVKMDGTNFFQWKNQIYPFLVSQDLVSHVDGSIILPPRTIVGDNDAQIPNPEYVQWRCTYQFVFGWINATLTDFVSAQTFGLPTARDVRVSLEEDFQQQLDARAMHLRLELQTLKKGELSIAEYLHKMKSIIDALNSIEGEVVTDKDLVLAVFSGLGPEYSFTTAILNHDTRPTFYNLRVRLFSYKQRLRF
ncbi:hypothetical protein BVC80_8991g43 [Macleaya cordata]|uniref:Uncharacterized protein n=1 Tax=Macleaya cordata TaxID=56857 RepID=A0A200QBN9_MACCD|nr:hypothetical protein BVC80_8991g43 [Macleaya cordata]